MPKSKYGPALFEVYGKSRPADADIAPAAAVHTCRTPAAESVSAFRSTLAALVRSIGGGARESDTGGESVMNADPAVAVGGGRIHFSLSSRGAGIAAFGLLLLASVCFLSGRWVGRQSGIADGRKLEQQSIQGSALDEIAQARQSAPVDGLFDDLESSPVAKGEPAAPAASVSRQSATLTAVTRGNGPTWVKGNTYVIVQVFKPEAGDEAKQACEFLVQNGIDAVVVGGAGKDHRLIATQGFNFKDETQKVLADRFVGRLRTIGEAYRKAGGRYKLEGYYAKLTADAW